MHIHFIQLERKIETSVGNSNNINHGISQGALFSTTNF